MNGMGRPRPQSVARLSTSLVSRFCGRGAINYSATLIREKREAISLPSSNSNDNGNSCSTVNGYIIWKSTLLIFFIQSSKATIVANLLAGLFATTSNMAGCNATYCVLH